MAFTTYQIIDNYGCVWMPEATEATLIRVASFLLSTNDSDAFDVIESEHVSINRAYVRKRTNLVKFCNQHHIEPRGTVSAHPRKSL